MSTRSSLDNWLDKLLEGDFLTEYSDEEKVIECLDSRDSEPFDSEWVRVSEVIARSSTYASDTKALRAKQAKYRKLFFEKVVQTTGSADLAGYVSDDMEMIVGAVALSIESEFVWSLVNGYSRGVVPDNRMARMSHFSLLS